MASTRAVLDFQAAVCRALDLAPERVVGLKFEVGPLKVRLVVEHYPTDEQLARIAEIVGKVEPELIREWRRDSRQWIASEIARRALEEREREADQ